LQITQTREASPQRQFVAVEEKALRIFQAGKCMNGARHRQINPDKRVIPQPCGTHFQREDSNARHER
jgi:hypothetical protein